MDDSLDSTGRILAARVYANNDTRQTGLNNNDLIIGGSGSRKTRSYVIPNILQASLHTTESLIIADTKGNLRRQFGPFLMNKGYKVFDIDFTGMRHSLCGYNPLDFIRFDTDTQKHSEQDILSIASTVSPITSLKEPYWETASAMYLSCLIAYVLTCLPTNEHDLSAVGEMADHIGTPALNAMFRELSDISPDCFAVKRYRQMKIMSGADKMDISIKGILFEKLAPMTFDGAEHMFRNPARIDFAALGKEKTAVFLTVSDSDRSMDSLISLFYTQAMQVLCRDADANQTSRLEIPVRIIMDDFATNTRIADFDKISSVVRSRDIYLSVIIQSISQLESAYGYARSRTIIDNFDTILFFGGQDLNTARFVSQKLNKTIQTVLEMPLDQAALFVRGQKPKIAKKYQLNDHPAYRRALRRSEERSKSHEQLTM